ncbi:MAG: sigma-54 interaction domain-containing protein [Kiritimatiellia bacterium]|jgi:PAS domain S-box-containing protein
MNSTIPRGNRIATSSKNGGLPLNPDQIRFVLDSLFEGVCTVDRDWTITSFNRSAQNLTGLSADEALGAPFSTLMDCGMLECRDLLRGVMGSGQTVRDVATRIMSRDGGRIPVTMNAAPLRDESDAIVGLVVSFWDNRPLEALRKELRQEFVYDDIVSKSPVMQRIFDILPAVAESDSSVLILGASGTGKELLARAIHRSGPRRDAPFVAVNCGALPDNLLESELFGYKKGAFTDARTDKPGRFALAEGGTLFLDEIGDTSPAMQVKLLRVLQERVYEPLGGTMPVNCDVRIISATNSDLEAKVTDGSFRMDLYYRINVVPLRLPSLAERREDIPLLVEHFIEKFNAEQGKKIRGVSQAAMARLLRHNYTGNIRELQNIIEHAYVICRCDEIQEQCLPPHLTQAAPAPPLSSPVVHIPPAVAPGGAAATGGSFVPNLRRLPPEAVRTVIEQALERAGGVRSQAAASLGIAPSTLWRRMKKLGMLEG